MTEEERVGSERLVDAPLPVLSILLSSSFSIQSLYSTNLPVTLFVPILVATPLAAATRHRPELKLHVCVDPNKSLIRRLMVKP